jgi:hypothetical protein
MNEIETAPVSVVCLSIARYGSRSSIRQRKQRAKFGSFHSVRTRSIHDEPIGGFPTTPATGFHRIQSTKTGTVSGYAVAEFHRWFIGAQLINKKASLRRRDARKMRMLLFMEYDILRRTRLRCKMSCAWMGCDFTRRLQSTVPCPRLICLRQCILR